MKPVVVLSLAWSLVSPMAMAMEGKVAEPAVSIDAQRESSYTGAPASESGKSQTVGSDKAAAHGSGTNKPANERIARAATVKKSDRFANFHLYGASSSLRADRDGDRYHSEFKVRFDADVLVGDATVYAKLYLRRAGESEWFLYHETDDFDISGQTSSDEYYVTTTLDDGYPTDAYDVLIDLYESGVSGLVATIGPADSSALSFLPLEEVGLDVPIDIAGYNIRDIATDLFTDADRDGYYSRFRITFDPDADYDRRVVYARIWVRARGGEWIEEYATADFWVETSGQNDAYALNVEWRDGYPTSDYDVQIDLHDAATDLLVASAGSDRSALAQIPLEDQKRDQYVSPPTNGSGGSTSSREGGGGAVEWWSLLGLMALGLARRKGRGIDSSRRR